MTGNRSLQWHWARVLEPELIAKQLAIAEKFPGKLLGECISDGVSGVSKE
jgi:hypothetical protein